MLKTNRGKSAELVICEQCGKEFVKETYEVHRRPHHFCSLGCIQTASATSIEFPCAECGSPVLRTASQAARSKSGRHFCGKSCSASYNIRLKRWSRRSSCEQKLLELLQERFPSIRFEPNDKTMLDGYEIDIAIPSLGIGIEWNGIVHFKPIYGKRKLTRIQEIDAKKEQIAREKGIDLIVIPDLVSTDAMIKRAFKAIVPIIESAFSQRN